MVLVVNPVSAVLVVELAELLDLALVLHVLRSKFVLLRLDRAAIPLRLLSD